MNIKKVILALGILLVILAPLGADAQTPFGGAIISMRPCLYPFGGYVVQIGPPTPTTLIYQFGASLSYSFGPPAHPGQWLLGISAPGVSCATSRSSGKWRNWRSGGLILFHGSSL